MKNFTPIDAATLACCGKNERMLYEDTIGRTGAWEYLEQQMVALSGHFVFTAGGHGDVYINFRDLCTLLQMRPVAMQMAYECRNEDVDTIIGTPHGADSLAVLIAQYWTIFTGRDMRVLKLLKKGDHYVWYKDHGERIVGAKILQVEDVINSAKSVRDTANHILQFGGDLRGVITGCMRLSDKNPGFDVLINDYRLSFARALVEIAAANYAMDVTRDPKEQCPLCRNGIKIDMRVGHGVKFLDQIRELYPDLHRQLS